MERQFVGLIGDVVGSRRLGASARDDLQGQIRRSLEEINERFSSSVAAKFLITIGDEFQGLLQDSAVLPELIRALEMGLPNTVLRLGIGRGAIHTGPAEYAIGMDGPAWHAAREALTQARAGRRLGGVFMGFGESEDRILNGFARVLHHIRSRLTEKQRELLEALLENGTQSRIAARTGVTKQAVSKQAASAGLDAYREGEGGWKLTLVRASTASPRP